MSRAAAAVGGGARRVLVMLALLLPAARPAAAQGPPPTQWTITGRVVRASTGEDLQPLPGVWVALNRVGDDSAGVVDSVRTGADGGYRFAFKRTGDVDAIYFTDVTWGGVAYFTDPLVGVNVSGEDAELVVFDTTSLPDRMRLRGRHLVVGPATTSGRLPVVEVFELTNDTSLTVVPRSDSQPVWSVALPEGAERPAVGDGDVPASVIRFHDGRAELHAPMAPGLRQLSIRYTLGSDDFPVEIALEQSPELLEVLLAGSERTTSGGGLHFERTVDIEGDQYARYLSPSASAGDTIVVTLGGAEAARGAVPAAIGVSVLILAAALVYARRTAYPSGDN